MTTLTEIKKEDPRYAVLYRNSGRITIVDDWNKVAPLKKGHSDATHKKFGSKELAAQWASGNKPLIRPIGSMPVFYTDGSYNKDVPSYGWSFVCLSKDGAMQEMACGCGSEEGIIEQRNVAGEMIGAMRAVQYAIAKGIREFEIRYDYAGLGKWVTGAFKTDSGPSEKYAAWMQKMIGKYDLTIHFLQMPGHTGEYYNEMADMLARKGCSVALTAAETELLDSYKEKIA